jgi:hypothetical protein
LCVANFGAGTVSVLLGNGGGAFVTGAAFGVGVNPASVVAGYFGGDGRADLAVADAGDGDVSVLMNTLHPAILLQPSSQTIAAGQRAVLGVSASGTPGLRYQWRRDGAALADGGAVSGAETDTLTIDPVAGPGAWVYDVVVTEACSVVSHGATLTVVCPADWNGSGAVNSQDFFDFLTSFFGGSADFNGDGATNSQDFFDFLTALFAGC